MENLILNDNILSPENLILMNKDMYLYIINNIQLNQLLILFTLSCTVGFIFCGKKQKQKEIENKYILVSSNEVDPVKGEVINKV
jgi:hypothetical protein